MAERDDKGRFVKGNKASPGRKPRARESQYLDVTFAGVSAEDWQKIVQKAVKDAIKGLPEARRWLSDYILGKPVQTINLTGADQLLLSELLDALASKGMAASVIFQSMLDELAMENAENDES